METVVAIICLLAAHLAASVSDSEWKAYKAKHGKLYEHPELDQLRRRIYDDRVEMIEAHNARYAQGLTSYTMGVNQFSDLLFSESSKPCLGSLAIPYFNASVHQMSTQDRPDSIDWVEKDAVTPVKSQGPTCGSCWAFSTTGVLEGQYAIHSGSLVSLSEQQLVDCAQYPCQGCTCGSPAYALQYIQENGGIETEDAYPYTGQEGQCNFVQSSAVAQVTGVVQVTQGDEDALQDAIATIGPISIAIDATPAFKSYSGGVFDDTSCSASSQNHAILIVGYGTTDDGIPYYKIKNSWTENWGIGGYGMVLRNHNNFCGIANQAVYPTVQ